MKDTMYYGSSPADEDCPQVTKNSSSDADAYMVCSIYLEQIKRDYFAVHKKDLPEGLRLRIEGQSHDFGTYYEVVGKFNPEDREAADVALWLDWNCSTKWDETSKKALAEAGLK